MPLEMEPLLTVPQAAALANCSDETIRRAMSAHTLAAVRFGSRNWRIKPADLRGWIDQGMQTQMAA